MNRRTCSIIGVICGASLLFLSCGSYGTGAYYPSSQTTGTKSLSTTFGTFTTPGYDCPAQGNITNLQTQFADFTVCTKTGSTSDIAIHGTTQAASICIFPAQVVDSTHTYWKIDASTGGPMSFCAAIPAATGLPGAASAVMASFPSTNYNAVYIVDQAEKDQMQSCMIMGAVFCPTDYAYGKFR